LYGTISWTTMTTSTRTRTSPRMANWSR
jgi:hypothetical protein